MQNTTEILIPEASYHVYNRTNGSERLFLSAENYRYFLQKFEEYILPVADTFCYCLMPNHFHFLLKIKTESDLESYFESAFKHKLPPTGFGTLSGVEKEKALSKLLSQQFSNLFNGYTQAFNKQQNRKGSLFMRPFKRKIISDASYLLKLVHYIHLNPVEATLCKKPDDWPYSSYPTLLNNQATFLKRNELISWFENRDNFIFCHSDVPELSGIEPLEHSYD